MPLPSSVTPPIAQCACRLTALYLDAFSPSCHRLGMPLTAPAAPALPMVDESGQAPPQAPITGSPVERNTASEVVDASAASSGLSHPTIAAASPAPPSNPDVVMSDGAAAGVSATSGENEGSTGSGSGSGVGRADGAFTAAPAAAGAVGTATPMEVDDAQPRLGAGSSPSSRADNDCAPGSVVDLSGDAPPAADVAAPAETEDGSEREAIGVAKASWAVSPPAAEAAPHASTASKDTKAVTTGSAADSSSSSSSVGLGKRRQSTTHTDLVVQVDRDAFLAKELGREPPPPPPRPAGNNGKKTSPFFGLRGVPGPDLGPFFRGTALDAKAVRKEGSGGSGSGSGGGGGGRRGSRLAAIAEGLRRVGKSAARTAAEAAAAEAMATRVSDGSATHEVTTVLLVWVLAKMQCAEQHTGCVVDLEHEWYGIEYLEWLTLE